jgi:serine/threonine-protein kinase
MEYVPNIEDLGRARPDLRGLEFVAAGGFKAVFKASVGDRSEAVKVIYIPPEAEEDSSREEIVARVKREIDALRLCRTKCLVSLGSLELQAVAIGGRDYLIYSEEFLAGTSLKSRIEGGHRPDTAEVLVLARCLLKALREIERIGHIHRDIKPANVIALAAPRRPFVLLDLGIAFKLHGTELTARGGGPPGTLLYMAPELFRPDYRDALDIRSDVYSVGVTLFEYAAGVHPLARRGEDVGTTIYRILRQPPSKLRDLRPELPERLCQAIDRCIKKRQALRYRNPQALLDELEGLT